MQIFTCGDAAVAPLCVAAAAAAGLRCAVAEGADRDLLPAMAVEAAHCLVVLGDAGAPRVRAARAHATLRKRPVDVVTGPNHAVPRAQSFAVLGDAPAWAAAWLRNACAAWARFPRPTRAAESLHRLRARSTRRAPADAPARLARFMDRRKTPPGASPLRAPERQRRGAPGGAGGE